MEPSLQQQGLSQAEAQLRLQQVGPNDIPTAQPHPLRLFLVKFWGPIPWMLEATIGLQLLLGKQLEALIVCLLLVINAAISLIQEGRASRAIELLRKQLTPNARVLRDNSWRTVPAAQLVPGDVVHLRMGDLAPADIKLFQGAVLIDQSALTGESVGVEAGPGHIAYAAATIRRGEATGEVTATGTRTYFGKLAELVRTARSQSHLAKTIFQIVRILMVFDLVLITLLFAYALWTGMALGEITPFALILLVASVPVALPATFTLATALGAAELARSGVLLTRLSTIEEAAGMDVLCTDKTGTLTENRLTLEALQTLPTHSDEELVRWAAQASDAATQDPIDMALLQAAEEKNLFSSKPERTEWIPFDPVTRYSLAGYQSKGQEEWVAKGAPKSILQLLGLPTQTHAEIVHQLGASGARVLAIASGPRRDQLALAGFVALKDPPRSDAAELVKGLQELGVAVIMVSGDNLDTAQSVAQQVGITGPVAAAGTIEQLTPAQAMNYAVHARVFPEHKIELVRLLQQGGHVVGMTGDGVNDAPALRQADVGIAVSSATDVARSAAGAALTTPGLVDVLNAVKISRRIYQRMLTYTINKIMKTLEIALFLTLGVMITHSFIITPLLVLLLLFTNDFVTMSIATDHVGFAQRPECWNVRHLMVLGGVLAGLVLLLSFTLFFVGRDYLNLPLPQLQTLVFVMLVATGQGNVYLVRERNHFWKSRPSDWMLAGSAIDMLLVFLLASEGILMAPVSPSLLLGLLFIVALYLLCLDFLKVRIFKRVETG